MTLAITTTRNDYPGAGTTSVFSYTFPITVATDLLVVVLDPTGALHTLVVGTDYTVTGAGSATGGSVTLVNANQAWLTAGNLATGYTLTLIRNQPLTQSTSIRNQGAYFPDVVENEFDSIVMKVQQLEEQISRTPQLAVTDTAGIGALPNKAARANTSLGFDSNGNPIATNGTSSVPVSAAMTPVVQNPTLAGALGALGAAMSGDATVNTSGVIAIGANKVTAAKVSSGAATIGQALLADGAGNSSFGSVASNIAVTTKTTTFTATSANDLIFADTGGGAWTLTLPAASGNAGKVLRVRKITSDFSALTISRAGSDTITDVSTGATSTSINTQGEGIVLVSDGVSVWTVIDRRIPSILTSYTATLTGFGPVSSQNLVWARSGDRALIKGYFVSNVSTGVPARISLPSGLSIGSTVPFTGSNKSNCGSFGLADSAAGPTSLTGANNYGLITTDTGTSTTELFFSAKTGTGLFSLANGSGITATGWGVNVDICVPISGWKG